jgi:hypothetical protein
MWARVAGVVASGPGVRAVVWVDPRGLDVVLQTALISPFEGGVGCGGVPGYKRINHGTASRAKSHSALLEWVPIPIQDPRLGTDLGTKRIGYVEIRGTARMARLRSDRADQHIRHGTRHTDSNLVGS